MEIHRTWAMPNSLTFSIPPVKDLLSQEITPGCWLDPFARDSNLSTMFTRFITNDLNPECNTDYHLEATEFLKIFKNDFADGIILDWPYSSRQIKECYQGIGLKEYNTKADFYSAIKDEAARVVKPNGKIITFGWNSNGIGKCRGFEILKILLIPHGGAKNDTIVTVEKRI